MANRFNIWYNTANGRLSSINCQRATPVPNTIGTDPICELYDIGIETVQLYDNSTLYFYNGICGSVWIFEDAQATISGGIFYSILSQQTTDVKHINMLVKSYDYNDTTDYLTGTWGDNTSFSILLWGSENAIDNIEFTIIPEPTTLSLLAIGAVLVRRR